MNKTDSQNSRGFKSSQNGHYQRGPRDTKGCFKCGKEGHIKRDCHEKNKQRYDQPVSLEFPDYEGKKLHDLPEELLSETQVKRPAETDVGISTYLNKNPLEIHQTGFNCILKHRYSDFNVNEIGIDGKVLYLTNLDIPECDAKPTLSETLASIKYASYNDLEENIKKWITPVSYSRLLMLTKKCSTPEEIAKLPSKTEIIRIDVTGSEKEERKNFHTWVKEQFPHLNSDGAKQEGHDPERKYIVLSYAKSDKFQVSDSDKWIKTWPRDRDEKFLHFTLYKEDYEQAELFSRITKILLGNRHFNQNGKADFKTSKYSLKAAGNKDKRARTSQRIAIKHVMAATMKDAVKKFNEMKQKFFQNRGLLGEQNDNVAVGNFEYKHYDIDLGDLKGNRFTIVLRNFRSNIPTEYEKVKLEGEEIHEDLKCMVDKAMHSIKHKGFINYFGLQRFGNMLFPKTSDVGLAMIKEEWQKVVELILYPRNNEKPSMRRARAHWWMYRNAKDALRLLEQDRRSSIEAILLKGLANHHENDIMGALLRLQKHTLLLYMHAYQALVWNKVVTRRIEAFGEKVLIGDFVLHPEGKIGNLTSEEAISGSSTGRVNRTNNWFVLEKSATPPPQRLFNTLVITQNNRFLIIYKYRQ